MKKLTVMQRLIGWWYCRRDIHLWEHGVTAEGEHPTRLCGRCGKREIKLAHGWSDFTNERIGGDDLVDHMCGYKGAHRL